MVYLCMKLDQYKKILFTTVDVDGLVVMFWGISIRSAEYAPSTTFINMDWR